MNANEMIAQLVAAGYEMVADQKEWIQTTGGEYLARVVHFESSTSPDLVSMRLEFAI